MDSSVFIRDAAYYLDEFHRTLQLFVFSYEKMLFSESFNLQEHEDNLRNLLVKKYLKEYKKEFDVSHLIFLCGMDSIAEDDEYKTLGRIDINIVNAGNLGNEDLIFVFECKRLDGYSSKNNEYIDNGLCRFIEGKYSRDMPFAGMVGFIQGFKNGCNANDLIDDVKNILKKHKTIKTIQNLTFYSIKKTFEYSYRSRHGRDKRLPAIDLYHLFFDFTLSKRQAHSQA